MKQSRFLVTSLCLGFIISAQHLKAQSSSRFSMNRFVDKGDTLNYRMLYPDADHFQKYPLLIFLHGSGERGSDNEAQLKWGVTNFASDQNMFLHPALVIAPQCPDKGDWSNFSKSDGKLLPQPARPMELLIGLIQQLTKTMPVDTNRIYITGLSMGGSGTFDAIERYPGLFAAAIPVCGAGDVSRASTIAHVPIWIVFGAEDPGEKVTTSSPQMLDALIKAGGRPGFTQYPGVGHFAWLGAYSDPYIIEWLFRQHK